MEKHLKLIFSVIGTAVTAIALVLFVQLSSRSNSSNSPVVPEYVQAQEPEVAEFNQISADGSENLVMKQTNIVEARQYDFSTNAGTAFTTTQPKEVKVLIPFNTWSPDNKDFFVQIGNDYTVVTSDGSTLTILDKFIEKYPNYVLTEATGWAAPNLVILNATNQDGTNGPSFWFNATTGGITQLSTKFN